jgi:hypothetical protein
MLATGAYYGTTHLEIEARLPAKGPCRLTKTGSRERAAINAFLSSKMQ